MDYIYSGYVHNSTKCTVFYCFISRTTYDKINLTFNFKYHITDTVFDFCLFSCFKDLMSRPLEEKIFYMFTFKICFSFSNTNMQLTVTFLTTLVQLHARNNCRRRTDDGRTTESHQSLKLTWAKVDRTVIWTVLVVFVTDIFR